MLFLFIFILDSSRSDQVIQLQPEISVTEGSRVKFDCQYETSSSSNIDLFWYIQQTGGAPRFILGRAAYSITQQTSDMKYESNLDKESKSIDLKISDVRVSDSGVYYCALRPTVSVTADCSVQEASALSKVLTH
uniref:Ig-like domain-containing protein n=1 Tax=Leptobrachium leishanense TaxID=445787 RepID=A0A8C5M3N2_9ANUR